jgi:hypothetical protein
MANEPLDPAPPDINDLLKSLQSYAPPSKATRPKPLASTLAVIGDALTALGGRQPQGVQSLVARQEARAGAADEAAARNVQASNTAKVLGFQERSTTYRASMTERNRQRDEQAARDKIAANIITSGVQPLRGPDGKQKFSGYSADEVGQLSTSMGEKEASEKSYARRKSILDDAARGVKAAPEELAQLEAIYPGVTNDAAILISKAKLGKFEFSPSNLIQMAKEGVDVTKLLPEGTPPELADTVSELYNTARFRRTMEGAVARLTGIANQAKTVDPADQRPEAQFTLRLAAAAHGLLPLTVMPQEPEMLKALYIERLRTMAKNILNGQMDPETAMNALSAYKKMIELFPGVVGLIAEPKDELGALLQNAGYPQQPLGESKNTVTDPINAPPDSSRYLQQQAAAPEPKL